MKKTLSINDLLLTDSELAVKWNDETESFISFKTLGNVYKGPKTELGETAYEALKLERIGHYAVRIFWGDRHADGLYTYELLKKLGNS